MIKKIKKKKRERSINKMEVEKKCVWCHQILNIEKIYNVCDSCWEEEITEDSLIV